MSGKFETAFRRNPDCPDPEILIAAMERAGSTEMEISSHVQTCPACQTELALYREFGLGEIRPEEQASVQFIVRKLQVQPERVSYWARVQAFLTPARMGGFALAAAGLLVAVGLSLQMQKPAVLSDAAGSGTVRSMSIGGLNLAMEVQAFPEAVRWDAVPGAVRYMATLTEVDRTVIFDTKLTTPELLVPEQTRRLLVPGKTILVEIQALDAAGNVLAQVGGMRVHVSPASVGGKR